MWLGYRSENERRECKTEAGELGTRLQPTPSRPESRNRAG